MANKRIAGITIEIGGDSTKLQTALKDVDKRLQTTGNNLKDVAKLLKSDPGNTDLLTQKQKGLQSAISDTKTRLNELKKAQNAALSPEEYDALQREIIETEQNLKDLTDEYKDFGTVSAQKLKAVGGKLKETGESITEVGKNVTEKLTAPIVAVGVAAVAAFNDVDSGMDALILKTGATGEALDDMDDIMQQIATEIPVSFEDAGNAVGEVNTRFGVNGEQLKGLSKQYLQFAKVNGTDVTTAVDDTQKALAAFNLGAEDAGKYLDYLTKTSQATGADVSTLSKGVVANATAFKEMGLSIYDATDMMGQLELSGADSSTVLGGLSKALKQATKDGKPLDQALQELQDSIVNGTDTTDGLTAAYDLFGKSGAQVYELVKSGAIDFTTLAGAAEDAGGTVASTFEATLDPADQFTTALNALKTVGAAIAEAVMPTLTNVLGKVRDVAVELKEKWDGLDEGQKETIVTVAAVVAAIGPVIATVGKVISTVGSLTSTIGTLVGSVGGLLPGGLIVAGLVAAGVLIYKNWDTIKAWVVETLVPKIKDAWEAIKTKVSEVFEAIKGFWENTLKPAFEALKAFVVETVVPAAQTAWEALKTTVSTVFEAIKGFWTDTLKPAFEALKKYVVETVVPAAQTAWEALKTTVSTVFEAIKGFWTDTLKPAFEALKKYVVETVVPAAQTAWEALKATVSTVFEAIKSFWTDTLKPAFEALKKFIVETVVPAAQTAWEALKTTVSTVFEAIKGFWEDTLKPAFEAIKTFLDETLKPIFESTFEAIKTTVDTSLKAIDDLWNKTVKPIYEGIVTFFSGVFTGDWTKAWDGIKEIVQGVWDAIQTAAETIWENAKTWGSTIIANFTLAFTNAWNLVKDSLVGLWDAIKDKAEELWEGAKQWGKDLINNFKNSISETWKTAIEEIKGRFNQIPEAIQSIVDSALNWGKDLIQNFKDGISKKWDDLKQGVSDIGQGIKDFLGFSKPKEGPLSDFDTYAPDMIALFVKGISDNIQLIAGILQILTTSIVLAFKLTGSSAYSEFNTALNGDDGDQLKNAIKNPVEQAADAIKTIDWDGMGSDAYNSFTQGLNGYWGDQLKNAIKSPIEQAADAIRQIDWYGIGKGIYEGMTYYTGWISDSYKNAFDFSNMYVKTPHWQVDRWNEISGTYYPDMSVHWYRKAYDNPVMFTNPTVLGTPGGLKGFGDGPGGEIVLSADKLRQIVGEAGDITINVYPQPGQDPRQIAQEVQRIMVRQQQQRSAAYA